MKHPCAALPDVAEILSNAQRVLLLSDYDGTLTPIVERPENLKWSES
jgi:trehalose-6-phosphatase